MTALPAQHRFTVDEYLRIENDAVERHEFCDGQILDMAGGTPEHALIAMNFGAEVRARLKGKPCRVYGSDLRVRIQRDTRYGYPDVTVICGDVELDPRDKSGKTVINPRLVVEVLSPSTAAADRGEKLRRYLKIESLHELVLIEQHQPAVESYSRHNDGGWRFEAWEGLETTTSLRSLGIALSLADVYAGVVFPPPTPPASIAEALAPSPDGN